MSGKAEISEIELHAYIDGELTSGRLHDVEATMEADPSLAERAAAFRAGKLRIKQVYGPLEDRRLPDEWVALVRRCATPGVRHISWRLLGSIAAVFLLLVAVGTYAFLMDRTGPSGEIVQTALEARGAASVPVKVLGIPQGSDVHQYDGVLTATVGLDVKVPDMTALGYQLIQIRLYGSSDKGAAELSYRDRENRLFTLYLRHSDGTVRFDQFMHDGLRICVWQDEEFGTVMAGNVSTAAMQRLASLAYTGLTL
jgi:anti-sigma factor RsiW